MDVSGAKPKYKYSLVCCMRWEDADIVEWIEYHKSLGFNHIFLYSNDDNPVPAYKRVLPYITGSDPFVTFVHFPKPHKDAAQQPLIYFHFMREFKSHTEWFSLLDADEFFVFKGVDNVQVFMLEYENRCDVLYFNWLVYGHGHKIIRVDDHVLFSQYYRSNTINCHTKLIVRSSAINPAQIENIYVETKSSFWHFLDRYNILGARLMNVIGDNMDLYSIDFPNSGVAYTRQDGTSEAVISKGYVAHFQFKSEDDFIRRVQRGGTPSTKYWQGAVDNGSYKSRLQQNMRVYDTYLLRYWRSYLLDTLKFSTMNGSTEVDGAVNVSVRCPVIIESPSDKASEGGVPYTGNVHFGGRPYLLPTEIDASLKIDLLSVVRVRFIDIHSYNGSDLTKCSISVSRTDIDGPYVAIQDWAILSGERKDICRLAFSEPTPAQFVRVEGASGVSQIEVFA